MNKIKIIEVGKRKIAVKGIGRFFYESGFPIGIAITELAKKDIEVSIFHVADECMRNGWSGESAYTRLKHELSDCLEIDKKKLRLLEDFCRSTYERQRQLIFEYLFKNKDEARKWFINLIQAE